MNRIADSVIGTIGGTPLIKLNAAEREGPDSDVDGGGGGSGRPAAAGRRGD